MRLRKTAYRPSSVKPHLMGTPIPEHALRPTIPEPREYIPPEAFVTQPCPITVSAIIPTYRAERPILNRCIKQVLPQVDEVILALEGNSILPDGWLEDPKIVIAKQDKKQIGYGANVNYGAAHSKGDVLLILNSDAFVDPDCVRHMVDCLFGQIAMACCYLRNHKGEDAYRGGSKRPCEGTPFLDNQSHANQPTETEIAYGACFVIRRDVFFLLGGFDEAHLLDFEDTDLSLRVRQNGFKIVFTPFAKATHQMSSEKKYNPDSQAMGMTGMMRHGKWAWYEQANQHRRMGEFGRSPLLNLSLPPLCAASDSQTSP